MENTSPMSYEEFYNQEWSKMPGTFGDVNPYNPFQRLGDAVTGFGKSTRDKYDNYLAEFDLKRAEEAEASARQWNEYMESTKYQRAVKDLKAAGLNPYLLLNGSGFNASAGAGASSALNTTTSRSSSKSINQSSSNNLSMIIAAIIGACAKLLIG